MTSREGDGEREREGEGEREREGQRERRRACWATLRIWRTKEKKRLRGITGLEEQLRENSLSTQNSLS